MSIGCRELVFFAQSLSYPAWDEESYAKNPNMVVTIRMFN